MLLKTLFDISFMKAMEIIVVNVA